MSVRARQVIVNVAATLCLGGCTLYTYTTFDVDDTAATSAKGINDSGKIVGTYVPNRSPDRLAPPTLSFIGSVNSQTVAIMRIADPDARETFAYKVDNRGGGQIVGWSSAKAFISPDGRIFDPINGPDGRPFPAQAYGINDRGNLVGHYVSNSIGHGFVLPTFLTFDRPNTQDTTVTDINNQQRATGLFVGSDGRNHCFIADLNGGFRTIDPPNARSAECWGINDAGQVVGWEVSQRDGNIYGFVRDANGRFTAVHCPGSSFTMPFGINNSGQIVGECVDGRGHRGFLATPM